VDLTESVARQTAIEQIEEPGFTPASFKSDANSARAVKFAKSTILFLINFQKKNKKMMVAGMGNKNDDKETMATHDRAMFGPMWANKQIEKKQIESAKQQKKSNDKESRAALQPQSEKLETSNNFPLAHENVNI
jgi:tRNA nucleotidyltransferase/poly(A) polymerase